MKHRLQKGGLLLLLSLPVCVNADQSHWVQSQNRWWYQEADGCSPDGRRSVVPGIT